MVNYFYNRYSINILASIIALFVVLIFSNFINRFQNSKLIINLNNSSIFNESFTNEINNVELSNSKEKWYLEIEKIGLMVEIKEGIDEEILNYYVGHFPSTPVQIGNVGLAAHNRGYENNYFSRLKELELGDKINYYINGNKFIYEVKEKIVIYETDWSMFENTNDNRITMIICIENREKYRLCVQAIRVKEE